MKKNDASYKNTAEAVGTKDNFSWKFLIRFQKWLVRRLNPRKVIWMAAGLILILTFIWTALGNFGLVPSGNFPVVSGSKWQAVFLTNGQVYFGHLQSYNRAYVRLKDVYYLQAAQPLQQGEQNPPNVTLIKLGGELHGPEDAMLIPKERILFWENMKPDSQVVRGIESTRR